MNLNNPNQLMDIYITWGNTSQCVDLLLPFIFKFITDSIVSDQTLEAKVISLLFH